MSSIKYMKDDERETVLNAVYRNLHIAETFYAAGRRREAAFDVARSYLDFLLGRVHADYDVWVIRDELGLPRDSRFSGPPTPSPHDRDIVLDTIYRRLAGANLAKRLGRHYKCSLQETAIVLRYLLGELDSHWARRTEIIIQHEWHRVRNAIPQS